MATNCFTQLHYTSIYPAPANSHVIFLASFELGRTTARGVVLTVGTPGTELILERRLIRRWDRRNENFHQRELPVGIPTAVSCTIREGSKWQATKRGAREDRGLESGDDVAGQEGTRG